jgi:hypothetical protein
MTAAAAVMIAAAAATAVRHAERPIGPPIAAQPVTTRPGRACSQDGHGAVRAVPSRAVPSREPTRVLVATESGAAGSARLLMT